MANDLLSKITSDTRPSDLVYALMSQHVYEEATLEAWDELPGYADWKILQKQKGASDYFSVIYVNTATKQLVVAHKGTDSFGTLLEDLRGVIFNSESPHKQEAFALTQQAINHIQNKGPYKDYHLSFTGHSLGGFLAELCVFYCPHSFNYHGHVNAVTFESPGVLQSLQKLESNLEQVNLDLLDIVGYVSYPNLINTFNNHIGTLYTFQTDLGDWGNWSGWYTKKAHAMVGMVECLQHESKYRLSYLTDWPIGSQRHVFFDEARFKDGKYLIERHDDFVEASKQHFQLDFKGHHHIDAELCNRTYLPLKHFSQSLQAFLKAFHVCLFNSREEGGFRAQLLEHWKSKNIPAPITGYLLGGYHIEVRKSGLEVLRLDLSQVPALAAVTIAQFREEISTWLSQSGQSIPELLGVFSTSLPKPALSIIAAVVATGATLAEGAIVTDNEINLLNTYLSANPSESEVTAAKAILSQFQAGVSSITAYVIAPGVHVPTGTDVSRNKVSVGNTYVGQSPAQLTNTQRRHEHSPLLSGTVKEDEALSAAAAAAAPAKK